MNGYRIASGAALAILLGFSRPAVAADSLLFEVGRSFGRDHNIEISRLGFAWDWRRQWAPMPGWTLGGYWETSVGQWRSVGEVSPHVTWDISAGPVLHLSRTGGEGVKPYLEAGFGVHWLSSREFSDALRTGTSYQFGSALGAGLRFGEGGRFDLGLRVRHLSNAGIRKPNWGVNVAELRLKLAY